MEMEKPSLTRIVNDVIRESDIVLEVLDARFPEKTRNKAIEDKIAKFKKKLIFILNKCDLVNKEEVEKIKKQLRPSIFVSATNRLGTTILLKEIMMHANLSKREKVIVGVVGYPNTGKSSVINALSGRHAAPTSPVSGYTRAKRLVRLSKNVYLMDTPGIFSYDENDELKSTLTATKDPAKLKDPVEAARKLIKSLDGVIERFYGVGKNDDVDQTLEKIAIKFKRLKKGGLPDVEVISRKIIHDWQRGKIPN